MTDPSGSGPGGRRWKAENPPTYDQLLTDLDSSQEAGRTLAAYVYSITNPGAIPETVKAAMRTFEG